VVKARKTRRDLSTWKARRRGYIVHRLVQGSKEEGWTILEGDHWGAGQHTVFSTLAFCELSDLVKSSELEVSWKALRSPEDAERQEWAAMYLYCRKYKEPPPLNLSVGRRKYMILGLGRLGETPLAPKIDDYVKSVVDP
jgi:hypothetical protein